MTNREWFELNYSEDNRLDYINSKCPPSTGGYPNCSHLIDDVTCDICWEQWFREEHNESEN